MGMLMSQEETVPPPSPRQQTINVRVTIDTDSVSQAEGFPGDAANPMSIAPDQGSMVVTASRVIESQGSDDIAFEASAGDTLRFFISSGSNNFEQPVLLKNISHTDGDEILEDLTSRVVEEVSIAPDSRENVLPARLEKHQFRFLQCTVAGPGTGSYDLELAIFDPSEEAQPPGGSHHRWAMQLTTHSR
jgi:hypothetical protein